MNDLHYMLRQARARPLFAALTVIVMALGVGATTAVFSLTDAVLFRPLPIAEPERVVRIFRVDASGRPSGTMNFPAYTDLHDHAQGFSHVAAYTNWAPLNLAAAGREPVRVFGSVVTGDYFNLFGVPPLLGRHLLPSDDESRGAHPVAVISEQAWRNHFNGDPQIIGTEVIVNTHPFTIVGVMPGRFGGADVAGSVDVWVPMAMMEVALHRSWESREQRGWAWHEAVARLAPGVSAAAAQDEVAAIVAGISDEIGGHPDFMRLGLFPVAEVAVDPWGHHGTRRNAILLLGVTLTLLLIAVSSTASLLLVRTEERGRELALRLGIGASRTRVLRMLTVESLGYTLVGAALGMLLAWMAVSTALPWLRAIVHVGPTDAALLIHWRVLAVACALAVAAALVAVLSPALRVMRIDLNRALKQGGAREPRQGARARSALVVGQITLSVALLAVALLLVRSFWHTAVVDPGFDPRNTLIASIDFMRQGYAADQANRAQEALVDRLVAQPSVAAAAFASTLPLDGSGMVASFEQAGVDEMAYSSTEFSAVSSGFFATLRIPLLEGRAFTADDRGDSARVMVVNGAFADRYLAGERIPGPAIRMLDEEWEVVGVTANVKLNSLREEPGPMAWIPLAQRPDSNATVIVRGHTDAPWMLLPLVREAVHSLDPSLPIFRARTMEAQVGDTYREATAMAGLLVAFAVIAVTLSTTGLYGLLAWQVRTRTREIGIRIAVGAPIDAVQRHILARGVALAALGIPLGLFAAVWTGRALESFLYGVSAHDPLTLAAVAATFVLLAVAATWLPARRSSQVDPMVALRDE